MKLKAIEEGISQRKRLEIEEAKAQKALQEAKKINVENAVKENAKKTPTISRDPQKTLTIPNDSHKAPTISILPPAHKSNEKANINVEESIAEEIVASVDVNTAKREGKQKESIQESIAKEYSNDFESITESQAKDIKNNTPKRNMDEINEEIQELEDSHHTEAHPPTQSTDQIPLTLILT